MIYNLLGKNYVNTIKGNKLGMIFCSIIGLSLFLVSFFADKMDIKTLITMGCLSFLVVLVFAGCYIHSINHYGDKLLFLEDHIEKLNYFNKKKKIIRYEDVRRIIGIRVGIINIPSYRAHHMINCNFIVLCLTDEILENEIEHRSYYKDDKYVLIFQRNDTLSTIMNFFPNKKFEDLTLK